MEISIHSVYTRPRLCPNCHKSCAPFTVILLAALSDYLKFQYTRSHMFYAGPPISACAEIDDISDETNTRYSLSCQGSYIQAMLTYVLQEYVS